MDEDEDNRFTFRVSPLVLEKICQLGINKDDDVNSFEEIGWFDPDVEMKTNQ